MVWFKGETPIPHKMLLFSSVFEKGIGGSGPAVKRDCTISEVQDCLVRLTSTELCWISLSMDN